MRRVVCKVREAGLLLPLAFLVLLLLAGAVVAQTGGGFDLTRWVVRGGGGTSAGGALSMSGTIGQYDTLNLSGGTFNVQGGFWGGQVVGAAVTTTIPLTTGWNLISLPLAPTNSVITQALSSIAGQYDLVYAYDAFNVARPWSNWNAAAPSFLNSLAQVNEKQGLWVRMTSPATLNVTGTLSISPIPLKAGWNLVGYPSLTTLPITTALGNIPGQYDLVYAYDAFNPASPWLKYDTAAPAFLNTLNTMGPGWGYWIRAITDTTWILP